MEKVQRRLAAIVAADVVGYSRLMGQDEAGTLARLKALRREIVHPAVTRHGGTVVKTTGDGWLLEFPSAVEAVEFAVAVQERELPADDDRRLQLRIGINVGDIIVEEDGDIYGDGVNIAARIEALADPAGICISRSVRDQIRDKLPYTLEDRGEHEVKNIARPVRVFAISGMRSMPLSSVRRETASLPLPDKPSIAVLPFTNMSGDSEQEYFADGMTEEIITALSRNPALFVISRHSSFSYKGQPVGLRHISEELGIRYLLTGSVRRGGDRIRITAELMEAQTAASLWADRFEGSVEDVFDLQDRVATSVAGVIEPALRAAETRRAAVVPTVSLTAYDLYLRALPIFYSLTKEGVLNALRLFERAIALDPAYGPALAWAAMCHLWRHFDGWDEDPERARREGISLARQALQVAGDDASVLANAALVLAQFGEDIRAMTALVDRSLTLDPSSARGWYVSGLLRLWAGEPDLAIEHVEISLRLSPRERLGAHLSVIGTAYLMKRQFGAAIDKLLIAIHERPTNPPPYRALACAYAHLGMLDKARHVVERLRALTPAVIPTATPFRNAEQQEFFLSGVRLAAREVT